MSTRLRVGGVHLVHDVIYDDKIIRCYHRLASLKPADHVKADAHCAGRLFVRCVSANAPRTRDPCPEQDPARQDQASDRSCRSRTFCGYRRQEASLDRSCAAPGAHYIFHVAELSIAYATHVPNHCNVVPLGWFKSVKTTAPSTRNLQKRKGGSKC